MAAFAKSCGGNEKRTPLPIRIAGAGFGPLFARGLTARRAAASVEA
jgi:hypothetical protein